MKKFFSALIIAATLVGLSSCEEPEKQRGVETYTMSGFYTINSGNKRGKIPASVTAVNLEAGVATPALEDAFFNANGVAIGDGAQKAIIHGGKMYIAMYTSNIIWIVEPATLKIIKKLTLEGDAISPRSFAAKDGKVYVSMYTGYVSVIDTLALNIERNIKVGPNPEGIAIVGDKLYCANSDGMNYSNKCANSYVSIVNLTNFEETKVPITDKFFNPTNIVTNGTDVFIAYCNDYGTTAPSCIAKLVGDSQLKFVTEGSIMAAYDNRLFVINNVYSASGSSFDYKTFDVKTLQNQGSFIASSSNPDAELQYPTYIFTDPKTGDLLVISQTVENGKANYQLPTYVNIYDKEGVFKRRVATGVGALDLVFLHTSKQ